MDALRAVGAGTALVWAAALCRADIRELRLPNALTIPGAAAILLGAAAAGRGLPGIAGAAALSGLYLVVHLLSPTGLGAGDVKLALGLGAFTGALGAEIWVLAALTAPLLTAALGVAGAACGRSGRIPHGPSMLVASLLAAALAVL